MVSYSSFHRSSVLLALLSLAMVALGTLLALQDAAAQEEPHPREVELDSDIAHASIEELLSLQVTTVSLTSESAFTAPAAVTVLTAQDIQRSGARSIPELLRLVPGVHVARIDANKWAVSIRGFNRRFANKLLVLIDGRSIYNPLLSGTLWETKDLLIEDIERIEVVRGPGGTTWGANAVNGVINIITKSAHDTAGVLAVAGGGSEEQGFTDLRYGARFSDNTSLRVFGKYYRRDEGYREDRAADDSYRGLGGFRFDHRAGRDTITLQGSYDGGDHDGVIALNDFHSRDTVLQGNVTRHLGHESSLVLDAYYTRTDLESSLYSEERDTAEVRVRHSFPVSSRFDIAQGFDYRFTHDDVERTEIVELDPSSRDDSLLGAFIQVRAHLIPSELTVSLGNRIEYNDYSRIEWLPDLNASWRFTNKEVLWASISRAARLPSRLENDFTIYPPGQDFSFVGNRDLEAESVVSYDLGYRAFHSPDFQFDLSGFYSVYDELVVLEGRTLENSAHGETWGFEVAPTWRLSPVVRLTLGYSYLNSDLSLDSGSMASPRSVEGLMGGSPSNQAFAHLSYDISKEWLFDFQVRYVDSLSIPRVSSYIVGDARIAWQIIPSLEIALVGQNLFRARHYEYGGQDVSQVQHGVYGQLRWNF